MLTNITNNFITVLKFIDNNYNKKKIIMTKKNNRSVHSNLPSIKKVKNYLIKNTQIILILNENYMVMQSSN